MKATDRRLTERGELFKGRSPVEIRRSNTRSLLRSSMMDDGGRQRKVAASQAHARLDSLLVTLYTVVTLLDTIVGMG